MTRSAVEHPSHSLPPRVLIVMPDQWPRALLRASLRDAGYDAVGTRTLETALRVRAVEPGRGPVRLVIVDQAALGGAGSEELLARLLERHGAPAALLLARATVEMAAGGRWQRVIRRPVSVAEVVTEAEALLPMRNVGRRPLD